MGILDIARAQDEADARDRKELEQLRTQIEAPAKARNDLIEEFCTQLEGLPYHQSGVRLEMARMLRGRLKTREEKEPSP